MIDTFLMVSMSSITMQSLGKIVLRAPIEVKFCTAKQTLVPVGPAKFDPNQCK